MSGGNSVAGRPTIRDVAAASGVSVGTVSQALNGKGRMDEKTRVRIREAASRLGYVPNPRARALRTGATNTIGLVASLLRSEETTPQSGMSWYLRTAVAAAQESLAAGYALTRVPPRGPHGWVQEFAVDGVLVIDPDPDDDQLSTLRGRGLPVVVISGDPEQTDVTTVSIDWRSAVDLVAAHVAERGAHHLGLIIDSSERQTARGTERAYRDWCAHQGVPPRIAVARLGEGFAQAGEVACAELCDEYPEVDAIYAPLDTVAAGASRYLAAADRAGSGRRVHLVTSEGEVARTHTPPLTGVDTRREELAVTATRLLLDQIRTGTPGESVVFETGLVVRD